MGDPIDLGLSEEGARREREVDLGDLVFDNRLYLAQTGIREVDIRVEDIGRGGASDIELALLGLKDAGVELDGLLSRDDPVPGRVELVDRVVDLAGDGLLACVAGGEGLQAGEDRLGER